MGKMKEQWQLHIDAGVGSRITARCERHPHKGPFTVTVKAGFRGQPYITCPICGRGYVKENDEVFRSDRDLTILGLHPNG